MTWIKKVFKCYIYIIGSILFLTIISTLLNYFDILNSKILSIINFIIPIFSLALGGFIIGKNSLKNGWLEGIKIGIIFALIILLFNIIIVHNINIKDIVFYGLLIISSIMGSMIGINQKEK